MHRVEDAGTYQPVPRDLQQVLLQDLLPMVSQISTAVLGLPGPAAYGGSAPDARFAGNNQFAVAVFGEGCQLCSPFAPKRQ